MKSCSQIEVIKLLLSKKVDINCLDILGQTPFHKVGFSKINTDLVKLLLDNKGDITA